MTIGVLRFTDEVILFQSSAMASIDPFIHIYYKHDGRLREKGIPLFPASKR